MNNCSNSSLNNNHLSNDYYTPRQLILPLDLEIILDFDDPVRSFREVMEGVNLGKYIKRDSQLGRIGYNHFMLLEIILFGFMENIRSLRGIEKACRTDVRFMWIAGNYRPTHTTIANFINNCLCYSIENIFIDINKFYIKTLDINTSDFYVDGTKVEAYANKYTFVWKKASIKAREKLYSKISSLIPALNIFLSNEGFNFFFNTKNEYTTEDLNIIINILSKYIIDNNIKVVKGKGNRKHKSQSLSDKFNEYYNFLIKYINIESTCGSNRNSYSKSDKDATFMRMKEDYMRNGQLKPGYNLQLGVSDEFILALGVYQSRDDFDTLIPTLNKYKKHYGFYPKHPVADAGYGNLVNYKFLKDNEMELYTKYSMYSKEKDTLGSFTDNFIKSDDETPVQIIKN